MSTSHNAAVGSPDRHADGLTEQRADPLRYDGHTDDPTEVAGLLRLLMPSGVRVLDVGCGTGSVAAIVHRDKHNQVVAIEPDADRAALARSRGLDVYQGYLDSAFLTNHDPFDAVMASDVLEHVASPADLLSSMVRAAKPGGLLLISVPNIAHWSVRLNLLIGRFDYEPSGIMDATHLRWFTARTVRALIESMGCELVTLSQTAGASLPVYKRGFLGRLPGRARAYAVRRLTRVMPHLFGVQHVLVARTPQTVTF